MKRGLGKGKGFEVIKEYSLIEVGDNPELLDLISNRIAIIYDMLYEDEGNNIINKEHFDFKEEDWDEI